MSLLLKLNSIEQKIDAIATAQIALQRQLANVNVVSFLSPAHASIGLCLTLLQDNTPFPISSIDGNRTWRLTRTLDTDNNAEEVVLRVQGIICGKTLPPIKFPFHMYVQTRLT